MSKLSRHSKLVNKSVMAMLSAIEIYNKPDFKYREEIFSILFINSWELLIKAKILKDNHEVLSSIQVPDRTTTKSGRTIKRFYPKVNRSGNPLTIDIYKAIDLLKLPKVLKANLESVVEIRDNSIHFHNEDKLLNKRIQEICTASLKSYLNLLEEWFKYSIAEYNFYLMPISFFHPFEIESFSVNSRTKQESNLINYLNKKAKGYPYQENSPHNFALTLTTKFEKGSEGFPVKVGKNGLPISINETSLFKTKYTISHDTLVTKCRARYNNFVLNSKLWDILRPLKDNGAYSRYNYLDPVKKSGSKKIFYCSEIFKVLDQGYNKH